MTDIDSLAAALFGSKRAESQEVLTDATTRTYVGTALTDSKDGTVMVDLGGDVTLPDDVEGVPEHSAEGIEVSTGPSVRAGDEVVVTLVGGTPLKTPMVTGVAGEGDGQNERIHAIEADYVKASTLEADVADIGFLKADSATIKGLQADAAKVHDLTADQLSAATAYIASLNAKSVTAETLAADVAKVHNLTADQLSAAAAYIAQLSADSVTAQRIAAISGDFDTVRANAAKVANLTAAQLEADHAKVGQLDVDQIAADHATIGTLDTTYATIANLNAANGRITNLESTKANISDLEADYIKADEIEATYMHANMSNSDVAWISNGTIKDGAITNAMINSVSANKLTAGTIDASDITVTNLNADNITTGTINGQRIGEGSLSLDKLSESVYTEAEVNNIVDGLNDRIDGAIETFTGTAVPTLNNQPASSWNTTKLRDEHVGDVYYVVNSQSQQNGYCYRFTKSGSTYSWQLIKDSDVTAALSRLTTAEGKITTFDSDISTLKTTTGTLTTKTESLETRMSDAESDILDKVDTTTFNEVSDTVDSHSQSITQMTTTLSNKADSSTVTAVTNRVSKNEQDISGINTTIGELQETVESKADGSTVSTISNKLNTVSDTVDGHTQTLTSVQNTLSSKADSSTVSTLSTKVNNVSDTVDGHTSQLSSITTAQTTMQTALDKTVKSSIQLWYSKADTTAPSKPTSQVTSTSTNGNAWRIVVPAYSSSYPHYYYCWQYEYVDGTYGWSAVVRDIAMGESQATARTADSNASAAATTANANIKSSVQLWFTKANSTAPNKPTSVVSTSNANTANAWNLVVPVWNKNYPHYFYCYQQQKGDGNYQWTDVVYDRATSEAQQLANTTSTNLSTLQTNYATFKQQTEQFESTVGTTYATKTELKGATDDITELEGRVSTNETSISNNASAIALKANSSDVYTKSGVDGLISTEVTDRNAAITAKANEITSTVSQTYTTKEESKQAIDYASNAKSNYGFQYCKDVVVFGDSDKYYPVYFTNLTSQAVTHEIMIMRNYAEQAPDDWKASTHKGSLNLRIRWNFGGWGGATYKAEITVFSEMYSTMLGDVLVGTDGGMFSIVFLRGGGTVGALYHVYSEVPFSRNGYMQNAGVVGENDVPYVGLTEGTVYAKSGNYQWSVRAPLTAPNTTHINQLYTVQRVIEAESSIIQTANEITSTVSKISSAKYVNATAAGWSLNSLKVYAAEGHSENWNVTSTDDLRVGDTVYVKGTDSTRNCTVYVKTTVVSVNSAKTFTGTSHGYEDVLPVDTIKSTINQSSDSVKIQAKHVEIDGTAVFSAISSDVDGAITSKGYQTSSQVNSAITSKGYVTTTQAQGYASTAKSEAISAAATDATTKANAAEANAKNDTTSRLNAMGADNKVVNGAFVNGTDNWSAWGTPTTRNRVQVNGKWWMHCVTTATKFQGYQQSHYTSLGVTVEPSATYTVGITARGAAANTTVTVAFHWYAPSGTSIVSQTWLPFTVGTTATRQYQTVTVPSGIDHFNVMVGQGVATAQEFWITDVTLVKGTVNQEWSESSALAGQASNTANAAAPKASAVKRTQRIWYRKSASGAPSTPGTASSNWVTKADDGNDAWTKMHIAISSTHKYIYTCEQYEMANGTVGYTSVLLDNTITVIDGGNIITGSVTANKLNAANINASKTLTVGAMTDAAASTILNSNVQIGGRNLLLGAATQDTSVGNSRESVNETNDTWLGCKVFRSSAAWADIGFRFDIQVVERGLVKAGDVLTYSIWAKTDDTTSRDIYGVWMSAKSGSAHMNGAKIATLTSEWTRYEKQITVTQAMLNTATVGMGTRFECNTDCTSGKYIYWAAPKLEKGNKATDWTPAPEDMATAESLAGTNESLEGAITDIGELSDQLVGTVTEQNKTITTIQTYLNSLRKDLDAEIQSRQQWLNFNAAEGLVIGAAGSTFKTVTTNTSQQFRSGGTVLAETSGAEFVAPVMRSDQLLIGNWMWTRRDNGNLSLKWIG